MCPVSVDAHLLLTLQMEVPAGIVKAEVNFKGALLNLLSYDAPPTTSGKAHLKVSVNL